MRKPKIIVICGQTATGKSDIAVTIAKKYDGEIISGDSRQVYRGMDLGTGKITKREMCGVPHHMLDIASPNRTFSAGRFQKLGEKKLKDIWKQNRIPIICGGTGFYIDALIDGIVFPEVKQNAKLRKQLERKSVKELFDILKKKDPKRAKNIDPKNPHRLIRAIEIARALGSVPKLQKHQIDADVFFIGIRKEKKELEKRISIRLKKRVKAGMIQEIKQLHKKGVSWKRLESFGLEYKYGALYLQKKIKKEELILGLEKAIMCYAKRQMTWFKRNKRTHWIQNGKEACVLVKKFLENGD